MAKTTQAVLIVAAVLLLVMVGLHIFAAPMMSSLHHSIHGM
jgi:hypothetical protein